MLCLLSFGFTTSSPVPCWPGPVETVAHKEVGLLCEPTPEAFAAAFQQLLCSDCQGGGLDLEQMGEAAKARVQGMFSRVAFGQILCAYLEACCQGRKCKST